MTEPKWTPGPWFAGQQPCQVAHGQWEVGLSTGISSGARNGDYMLLSGCCREADARLIAAAPDMAEALKSAISHIEHMAAWITSQNAGYSFESIGEDMPGLKAALAKAGAL